MAGTRRVIAFDSVQSVLDANTAATNAATAATNAANTAISNLETGILNPTVVPTVLDIAALKGIDTTGLTFGTRVDTQSSISIETGGKNSFYWSPSSTDVANDISVVIPNAIIHPSPGRWLIMGGRFIDDATSDKIGLINGAADSSPAMANFRTKLPSHSAFFKHGFYRFSDTALQMNKDMQFVGLGRNFQGTVILPTTNTPMVANQVGVVDLTRFVIRDFLFQCEAVTSAYVVDLDRAFLSLIERVWIRNSTNGVRLTNSNAVSFNDVMIMEDAFGTMVFIGAGSTNIKFNDCNFEQNPRVGYNPRTTSFIVDGTGGGALAQASLIGSQFERTSLYVNNGRVNCTEVKFGLSVVVFGLKSSSSSIKGGYNYATGITDFGFNTVISPAYATNMAVYEHKYPTPSPIAAGLPSFGVAGEEWFFLVSATNLKNTIVEGCQIDVKEGASVVASSPVFDLNTTVAISVGTGDRNTFTYPFMVKSQVNPFTFQFTNCDKIGIRGGKNLLLNGMFDGNTTGWTAFNVTPTLGVGFVTLTPTSTNWKLAQNINSICTHGKKYIVIGKWEGPGALVLGDADSGTIGRRSVLTAGEDLESNGIMWGMLSFEFNGQAADISFGNLGNNTPVNLYGIMLIEA